MEKVERRSEVLVETEKILDAISCLKINLTIKLQVRLINASLERLF